MNKLLMLGLVSACLASCSSIPSIPKCQPTESPTIEIVLAENTFSYRNKGEPEAVPKICRDKDFDVAVSFRDSTIKRLVLKEFRPTYTGGKNWNWDPLISSARREGITTQMVFERPDDATYPHVVTLEDQRFPGWDPLGIVKVRIILMTAEMTLEDGEVVVFDPPWGERP